jgi:hypothetical protein
MLLAMLVIAIFGVGAGAPAQTRPATAARGGAPTLTVAVIDFEVGSGAKPESGKQIAEALMAMLSGTPGIKLVDRASLDKALQEQSLTMTGLSDDATAIKVGKIVGAQLLVTGKAFTLGKSTYITGKIISTETSLVAGVLSKGKEDDDLGNLVADLAEKIKARIAQDGAKLVASGPPKVDAFDSFKAVLETKQKPKVMVRIPESHVNGIAVRDPAAETEVKSMLVECGFTVVDPEQAAGGGVEVNIEGEAFSEFGARVGNLVSCTARVEIKMTKRSDGTYLMADKATARAADLSEQIAGKTAIQQAGHAMGLKILEHFAKTLPDK